VAGLAFAFAPYRLAAIAHLQLLTIQWLPFSVLALDRVLGNSRAAESASVKASAPSRWAAPIAQLVVFATLQALASWYLAVFAILIMVLYTLGWLVASWRQSEKQALARALLRLAIAGVLVVALILPFALPYLDVLPQLQASRPLSWAVSFATRPTDLLAAAPFVRLAGPLTRTLAERPGFTEENTLYLGIGTCVLALAGLALGRPRWRALSLAAILAVSLVLTFAGPYQALTRLIPFLTVVRVPPRWIIPATFALAALVGLGVAAIRVRIVRRVVVVVASLLLVAESFAAPLPLAQVGSLADLAPVYRELERLHSQSQGAVIELPMHVAPAPEYPETKRMYASTLGWWDLVNGYSGFTPDRQMVLGGQLADPAADGALAALGELGTKGVRYLIIHPDEAPLDRSRWDANERWQIEHKTTLLPLGPTGPDELYLINPYGDQLVTEPQLAADDFWSAHRPVPLDVHFELPAPGGDIRLLAYLILPGTRSRSKQDPSNDDASEARLALYWQTAAPVGIEYTVFVHSLDGEGQMAGQADGPPVSNHYPTTAWQPGEIVQDSRLVPVGARYLVGLYDPASSERLPAFTAGGTRLPDDAVSLSEGQP